MSYFFWNDTDLEVNGVSCEASMSLADQLLPHLRFEIIEAA